MERKINISTLPLRNSMKSLEKYQKDKGISLYQLQTLNNNLQNDQIEKKKFLQKIKQERINSQKIGQYVNEQIGKVQNTGAYFASRLQQEKRKYNILTALVSHYQSQIYNQKKQKHQQQMKIKKISKPMGSNSTFYKQENNSKSNQQEISKNQQLQQSLRQLDQLQKNYEQFIVKNNNSQYQLSNKLDQVRTLRSQRTIFNKVFDQFEKQLFNHQFTYKQLVIERSVLQNCFEQKVKQFEILNLKAQKQCQKQINNHKKKLQTQRVQFLHEIQTRRQGATTTNQVKQFSESTQRHRQEQKKYYQSSNRFTIAQEIQIKDPRFQEIKQKNFGQKKVDFKLHTSGGYTYTNRSRITHSRLFSNNINTIRTNEKKSMKQKPLNESKNLEYEQKVKDVYNDLKISHSSQIPQLVFNLQEKVQNLYKQAQQIYEKIYKKQTFLQNKYKKIKQCDKSGLLTLESPKMSKNCDENHKMQVFIAQRQQLYEKINSSQKQRQKLTNQLNNFITKQIIKLQDLFQAERIPFTDITNQQQNQKKFLQQGCPQIRRQKLENAVQKLQKLLTKIIPLEKQISRVKEGKKQRKNKENKEKSDESSNYKQNQSRRDTHKSLQSEIFLGNASKNSYFLKFKEDRDRSSEHNNKQKYCRQSVSDQFDENYLQQILKANRTTHNNMSIYSEQQLIQISKLNLSMVKNKNKKKHQSTTTQKQQKCQTQKNHHDENMQIRKDIKQKSSRFYEHSQQSVNNLSEVKLIY